LLPVSNSGCGPSCPRDQWYFQKERDLLSSYAGQSGEEALMKRTIFEAARKLARAIPPTYYPFPDVAKFCTDVRRPEEKKKMGVVDIYKVDTGQMTTIDSYITDFLIGSCMANVQIGENFRFVERYKLGTLIEEYNLRRAEEFDAADAISKGAFKGLDSVLTGNVYIMRSASTNQAQFIKANFMLRLVDVKTADIVANVAEGFPMNVLFR